VIERGRIPAGRGRFHLMSLDCNNGIISSPTSSGGEDASEGVGI